MSRWYIDDDGQGIGGHLAPPGDPSLRYTVREGSRNNPLSLMSLESAVTEDYVPEDIRQRAAGILAKAQRTPSETWIAQVYGYFKNSYSPDGVDRNVSNALIFGKFWGNADEPRPPAERSLAVMFIRQYFPDHEPRLDLLDTAAGYGTRPCTTCGVTCQYEARIDGWAPFGGSPTCENGGPHHV